MITRLTVTLRADERDALRTLAAVEFREPRQQAALIIRQELERRGLLPQAQPAPLPPALVAHTEEMGTGFGWGASNTRSYPPPQDAHPEEMQNVN